MSVNDGIVLLLAAIGSLLLLVSAVGTVRLQGVHQRMQAASVGASMGITLLLLSAGVHFIASDELILMILLIVFFFVTSPISATAMARAAYRRLPHTTHRYLLHDDLADPSFTPDYRAREIDGKAGEAGADATTHAGASALPTGGAHTPANTTST